MGSTQSPWVGRCLASNYLVQQDLGADLWGQRLLAIHRRSGDFHDLWVGPPGADRDFGPWAGDLLAAQVLRSPALPGLRPLGPGPEGFVVGRPHLPSTLFELSRQRLPIPRVLQLGRQLLVALGEAHSIGLAHQALSPVCLAFDPHKGPDRDLRLIDFSRGFHRGRRLWSPGPQTDGPVMGGLGEVLFLAPEVIVGRLQADLPPGPSDELEQRLIRADLYSVGAVLFAALAGRAPFLAESTTAALLSAIQGVQDPPLTALRPDAPPVFCGLIASMMDLDPGARPSLRLALDML